ARRRDGDVLALALQVRRTRVPLRPPRGRPRRAERRPRRGGVAAAGAPARRLLRPASRRARARGRPGRGVRLCRRPRGPSVTPAAALWLRVATVTAGVVALLVAVRPPQPAARIPPAAAAVLGLPAGVVLFAAAARRRPRLP